MTDTNNTTIYVGNLPNDLKKHELYELFEKYGLIVDVQFVKGRQYNFLQFENRRDALEAIRGRNGCLYDGSELKVSMSHGMWGNPSHVPNRTKHKVLVKNLPSFTTWQELKDHMRMAGPVCFADVWQDGKRTFGLVEYMDEFTMDYAIRKLDKSKFKNKFMQTTIAVMKYDDTTEEEIKGKSQHKETNESPCRNSRENPRPQRKHSRSPPESHTVANKRRRV